MLGHLASYLATRSCKKFLFSFLYDQNTMLTAEKVQKKRPSKWILVAERQRTGSESAYIGQGYILSVSLSFFVIGICIVMPIAIMLVKSFVFYLEETQALSVSLTLSSLLCGGMPPQIKFYAYFSYHNKIFWTLQREGFQLTTVSWLMKQMFGSS